MAFSPSSSSSPSSMTCYSITSEKFKINDPANPKELNFLCKLLYCSDDYVYQEENLKVGYNYGPQLRDLILSKITLTNRRRVSFKAPDLGRVKHYDYYEIQKLTHSFSEQQLIKKTVLGRLFRANLNGREVAIKTWDFSFPPQRHFSTNLYKFVTELLMLTKGEIRPNPETVMHPMEEVLKSNENLVKVMGYSCDRICAVVYDLQSRQTLEEAIPTDTFVWESRVRLAMEMAQLVRLIHDYGHSIGTINAENIMIDQEGNFKLFVVGMDLLIGPNDKSIIGCNNAYFWEGYAIGVPEMNPDVEFSFIKADTFAFGILLLELITKKLHFYCRRPRDLKQGSIVDASFGVKDDIGLKITELVRSCLNSDPDKRPEMSHICAVLEKVNEDLLRPP